MNANLEKLTSTLEDVRSEVRKVIIGQDDVIDQWLIVIFTGQHALIEGVPGVAKTLLVRTLAHVLGCEFARIQFTPDLMPADITGTNVFNLQRNEFTLVRGPVFTTLPAGRRNQPRARQDAVRAACRPCRSAPSPSTARPTRCPPTSPSSPRRTPSNTKAPIRCPRRRRTASC